MHHAIRIAAFDTAPSLASAIVTGTGYPRRRRSPHPDPHRVAGTGDVVPDHDTLHIRLDPLPAPRHTAAIDELCPSTTSTPLPRHRPDPALQRQIPR